MGPTDRWDRKCVTGSNSDSGGHLGTTEPTVTSINPGGKWEASFFFLETINCCQGKLFFRVPARLSDDNLTDLMKRVKSKTFQALLSGMICVCVEG